MAIQGQQKSSEIFRLRLRTRMARLNFQANRLAEALGVAPGAVSNWLNGTNMPKFDNIKAIADLLGCDANWLKGEDVPEVPARAEMLHDAPIISYEAEHWRERAMNAEKQLANLRNGLHSLLELTSPQTPTKPLPERIPGTSSASTTPAGRAALKRAGEMISPAPGESSQTPATDAPTARKGEQDPTVDKD